MTSQIHQFKSEIKLNLDKVMLNGKSINQSQRHLKTTKRDSKIDGLPGIRRGSTIPNLESSSRFRNPSIGAKSTLDVNKPALNRVVPEYNNKATDRNIKLPPILIQEENKH